MKARRVWYCRRCTTETAQQYVGSERGPRDIDHFKCTACGLILLAYADVGDAEGFAEAAADAFVRRLGVTEYGDTRSVDREEIESEARALLWAAYLKWDPSRNVRFRSHAAWYIDARLVSWLRRDRGGRRDFTRQDGTTVPVKAHIAAVSLDAPARQDDPGIDGGATRLDRLESALGQGRGDNAANSGSAFDGVLSRRGRGVREAERALGLRVAS